MDEAPKNLYFSDMRAHGNGARPGEIPAFFLYGEPLHRPGEQTMHVETIASRSRLNDWNIRPHRHPDLHQILLVRRGPAHCTLDTQARKLQPPAFVVLPPGCVHSFRFSPHTTGIVISFDQGRARELARGARGLLDFLQRPGITEVDRESLGATDLYELAEMLLREFARSAPGRDTALAGLLAALLANLLRLGHRAAAPAGHANRGQRGLVAAFRQAMERRYRERAAIADYARTLGASETRLRRACLAVAGQSPTEMVHARLLVEAARQLRYTASSVAEIAYLLGFDDPAYFSRFFKERMRVSPREFRRSA
jgi:AraC family transcriptional regulator, transcriptional activator of pobA